MCRVDATTRFWLRFDRLDEHADRFLEESVVVIQKDNIFASCSF